MEFFELVAEAVDEEVVAFGAGDRPGRVDGGPGGEAFGYGAGGYAAEYPGDEPVAQHERAHLAGRHHLLLAITRCLAAIAPGVPLFTRASRAVTRLAEMRADDIAARHAPRRALLTALLTMSDGAPAAQAPAAWLAATGGVVAARVRRLADPPPRARWLSHALALTAITLATLAGSALVVTLA